MKMNQKKEMKTIIIYYKKLYNDTNYNFIYIIN